MQIVFSQEAQKQIGGFRSTAIVDAMIMVASGTIHAAGELASQGKLACDSEEYDQMCRVYSYLMTELEKARSLELQSFVSSNTSLERRTISSSSIRWYN